MYCEGGVFVDDVIVVSLYWSVVCRFVFFSRVFVVLLFICVMLLCF